MIILEGKPISTQHIYGQRGKIRYMKKEGKELKESYQWQVKSQWKKPMIEGDCEVEIDLYFGDRRRRDWDNWHKLTMDALEGIVIKDDSQIQRAIVNKKYDKSNPRVEIKINEK